MWDKENQSPTKMNDLSMYDCNSPVAQMCMSPHTSIHRPLEDHDSNSVDSGFNTSCDTAKFTSYSSTSRGSFLSYGSSSMSSMDDDFMEDFSDIEPYEKHNELPEGFEKLLEGPLINKPKQDDDDEEFTIRPQFRRSVSYNPFTSTTPTATKVRSCLFSEARPLKRSEPLTFSEISVKRSKILDDDEEAAVPIVPVLKRAFSATDETIISAVQRSSDSNDLIADFSKAHCLPLTNGKHQDLRAITPHTLAALIKGEYSHTVNSFKIIDCRYPYEYNGGHIDGAVNIYTKEGCLELLHGKASEQHPNKRNILIFHCEFSSERGPNLYRYLRKEDRTRNIEDYPSLNYPEIYLLEGGYKNFFHHYSNMCIPIAYKEMLHPEHEADLRHFRQKSKTWNADSRHRPQTSRRRFGRLQI